MFLFLFAAIITNACGKNSQKPEIGSMRGRNLNSVPKQLSLYYG